jgi:hypothetical protein
MAASLLLSTDTASRLSASLWKIMGKTIITHREPKTFNAWRRAEVPDLGLGFDVWCPAMFLQAQEHSVGCAEVALNSYVRRNVGRPVCTASTPR